MIDAYIRTVREVVKVNDGDTYEFMVDLGYRTYVRASIRVNGLNSAELNEADGATARDLAKEILSSGKPIVVKSYMTRTANPLQSFSRWIADVYVGGVSIVTLLENRAPRVVELMRIAA